MRNRFLALSTLIAAAMGAALWTVETSSAGPAKAKQAPTLQRTTIVIDHGYEPATVTVKAGQPVELTFLRKEKSGCGEVVQLKDLGLKRTLKPGEKAVVTFTPKKAGTIAFTCGMSMYQGKVVVK